MSAMSEKEKKNPNQEASIYIKIIWGLIIGSLTYIMLSTKGLDGIRILSLLGGFPALFIIIFASISLLRFLFNKKLLKLED
jgi:choline-glycine betaine transporter